MRRDSENLEKSVLKVLHKLGTATINQIARTLGRKHEVVTRAVLRLEEKGKVHIVKGGTARYVILHPSSVNMRVRPDHPEKGEKGGNENEGYARASCEFPISRSKTVSERVPIPGTVLHPKVKGCDLSREWIRAHCNGEFQIAILEVGDFRPYNRNDDVAVDWKTARLNGNTAYNGKVYLKGADTQVYTVRAVSRKDGTLSVLSVRVHPRYVFHEGHEQTALAEFRQQVLDVCGALEVHGWRFDKDTIALKGELHSAINDSILGSQVGRYNQTPDDSLHFDHSHGIPECEVYGSDPDTVELMVRLPETIRAMASSMAMLTALVGQIIDVQNKTISIIVPKENDSFSSDMMYR